MVVVGLNLFGTSGTTLYSLEKTPRSKRGDRAYCRNKNTLKTEFSVPEKQKTNTNTPGETSVVATEVPAGVGGLTPETCLSKGKIQKFGTSMQYSFYV